MATKSTTPASSVFPPPPRLLLGPGPSQVHPRVLAAMGQPLVGHLDPAFIALMEETKRLLYVALTRARNRLYLSAAVQNGVCRTGRGSLGEVLPAAFRALFEEAARLERGVLTWTGATGAHRLLVGSGQ